MFLIEVAHESPYMSLCIQLALLKGTLYQPFLMAEVAVGFYTTCLPLHIWMVVHLGMQHAQYCNSALANSKLTNTYLTGAIGIPPPLRLIWQETFTPNILTVYSNWLPMYIIFNKIFSARYIKPKHHSLHLINTPKQSNWICSYNHQQSTPTPDEAFQMLISCCPVYCSADHVNPHSLEQPYWIGPRLSLPDETYLVTYYSPNIDAQCQRLIQKRVLIISISFAQPKISWLSPHLLTN